MTLATHAADVAAGNLSTRIAFDRSGAGRPIVLVHGFPLDRTVWADVAGPLHGAADVIRPDLPGFGDSTVSGDFTIAGLADLLAEFVRGLGVGPIVLAGLSMGGYVALALALRHRELLAGLALVDTRPGADTPEGRAKRDELAGLARREGAAAVADAMLPNMLGPSPDPAVADRLRAVMAACPAETIVLALMAMKGRDDVTPLLATLDVPAAVVCGEHDAITPTDLARTMAAELPDAELTIVPDAGHMTPMEQPAAVAAALWTLLDRIG